MIKNKEKNVLLAIKKVADKQLSDTVQGRCLFLCYQPPIPKKLLKQNHKNLL
ncbi:MAG: cyclic lactone autoinducer peptide [Bacilli bacterium]